MNGTGGWLRLECAREIEKALVAYALDAQTKSEVEDLEVLARALRVARELPDEPLYRSTGGEAYEWAKAAGDAAADIGGSYPVAWVWLSSAVAWATWPVSNPLMVGQHLERAIAPLRHRRWHADDEAIRDAREAEALAYASGAEWIREEGELEPVEDAVLLAELEERRP